MKLFVYSFWRYSFGVFIVWNLGWLINSCFFACFFQFVLFVEKDYELYICPRRDCCKTHYSGLFFHKSMAQSVHNHVCMSSLEFKDLPWCSTSDLQVFLMSVTLYHNVLTNSKPNTRKVLIVLILFSHKVGFPNPKRKLWTLLICHADCLFLCAQL